MYTQKGLYIMFVYIPVFIITLHNSLYSADRKEQKDVKKEQPKLITQWHYEPWWDLPTLSPIDQGPDLWTQYIEALKAGEVNKVCRLLQLMETKATTHPKNYFKRDQEELPINDCSGLAAVVEAKALSDQIKITLMEIIINFYQPKKDECDQNWLSPCNLLCNKRRKTFIVYGLAKAGERCLELNGSDSLRTHIYTTHGAFITQDALTTLKTQNKIDLMNTFAKLRTQQHENKQLLSDFNCFHRGSGYDYAASEYYYQVAQPVITQRMLRSASWWRRTQLCNKE